MSSSGLYSIGEVAAAFRLPVSTLRYYDDIGLVTAPVRRSRVRHYDRAALEQLVYVQMWCVDAMMSLEHTAATVASTSREERHSLIEKARADVTERIARLAEAQERLDHMLRCPADNPMTCPVTLKQVRKRVDESLGRLPGSANAPGAPGSSGTEAAAR